MIEILKASAGSGKTWNLAMKYISLLLQNYGRDRYSYRHILAVTFTNKATDEMKQRILKELHQLARDPQASGYYELFVPSLMPDAKTLSEAASTVLCNILHDYSAFAVSTIDSFFQQALKAFSREIGQFASYQVELDRDSLIRESVDRVLDSLGSGDAAKLKWITDQMVRNIEKGGKYRLESSLYEIARRLKSEQRRQAVEDSGLPDRPLDLESLRKTCSDLVKKYCDSIVDTAKVISNECNKCGINPQDTSRQWLSRLLSKALSLKPGDEVKQLSSTVLSHLDGSVCWFNKKDAAKMGLVSPDLDAAVSRLYSLYVKESRLYNTALILKDQIYALGLADDLSRQFDELLREKNVLSLDDSNSLLKDIIDGTDTPFIYEKLGVRFDNFLLDEFQDTSRVQWENFRPLLENSNASGKESLVVGDVKQSIYRWRGSDWNLLRKRLQEELGEVSTRNLDVNWRSPKAIVDFNNRFFEFASGTVQEKYDPSGNSISSIYADVSQSVSPKKREEGLVAVEFCSEDEELERMVAMVNEALEAGFAYRDIAVLVRNNSSGSLVAERFIREGIPVVTDDSLKLKSSAIVNRLMALLGCIDNPENSMASFLTSELSVDIPSGYHSLQDLCEILLRELRDADSETFRNETLYVQSFMDKVHDFSSRKAGGLHAFLEMMEEDDSCISSPSSGNSLRIMTIHKSKGLDFPYVIVPFLETIKLYRDSNRWCRPEVKGSALEPVDGVYDVRLSGKSANSCFESSFKDEQEKQYVDNLNVAYVAFTRASSVMRLLGEMPEKPENILARASESANFSELLFCFAEGGDRKYGSMPRFERKEEPSENVEYPLEYKSWPLGERLSFSCDSGDFFSDDSEAALSASARRRGIILHDILSSIVSPSELPAAVHGAVLAGLLPQGEEESVLELLSSRIASVEDRGWFPRNPSAVWNETSLLGSDGEYLRPDRVVELEDGTLAVIDYKFGAPKKSYIRQVNGYGRLYRAMGREVRTYLWYVDDNNVVETENSLPL